MPVILAADEWGRWLDNDQIIEPDDRLFRSELKMPLHLQPLSRVVSNARNKDLAVLEGVGDVIELAA
jgi:putative SOS response-associated peptidase YedK